MPTPRFAGFPLGLLHFLEDLGRNNTRQWFAAHRHRYEQELRQPALALIATMEKPLAAISPHLTAVPKKVGGSLIRIHRDTRFSKDKSPYKTNVGIQFRHRQGKDVHAPGYYFHIDTQQVFLAAGVWRPDSPTLSAIRRALDERPADWRSATGRQAFRRQFHLGGDSLVRPPRGYPADHPLLADLKRKDHIAIAPLDHEVLFDGTLVRTLSRRMRTARPYLQFLCEAIGVEF